MAKLSVNVNKVATLRNSRGGREPNVLEAVEVCLAAGAPGITVHPRADRRHITPDDVRAIAQALRSRAPAIEYNIEGDPRPELLDLVDEVRPDQCTLVPVVPGEVTSQAGWQPGPRRRTPARGDPAAARRRRARQPVRRRRRRNRSAGPRRPAPIASSSTPSRSRGRSSRARRRAARAFAPYAEAAELAHALGLGVNAGHDLDLANLTLFRDLPFLDEVSIGHAIMSRALFVGLSTVVREYLQVLAGRSDAAI